jgi:hypothetical protein
MRAIGDELFAKTCLNPVARKNSLWPSTNMQRIWVAVVQNHQSHHELLEMLDYEMLTKRWQQL